MVRSCNNRHKQQKFSKQVEKGLQLATIEQSEMKRSLDKKDALETRKEGGTSFMRSTAKLQVMKWPRV
jgi:hypothetical protein